MLLLAQVNLPHSRKGALQILSTKRISSRMSVQSHPDLKLFRVGSLAAFLPNCLFQAKWLEQSRARCRDYFREVGVTKQLELSSYWDMSDPGALIPLLTFIEALSHELLVSLHWKLHVLLHPIFHQNGFSNGSGQMLVLVWSQFNMQTS